MKVTAITVTTQEFFTSTGTMNILKKYIANPVKISG